MNKIGRLMVFAMFVLLVVGMMVFIFTISKGSGKSIWDVNSEAAGHYFDKEVVNIISAEHLSKDRKIISNIYERVRELDDKWSKKKVYSELETIMKKSFDDILSASSELKAASLRLAAYYLALKRIEEAFLAKYS